MLVCCCVRDLESAEFFYGFEYTTPVCNPIRPRPSKHEPVRANEIEGSLSSIVIATRSNIIKGNDTKAEF